MIAKGTKVKVNIPRDIVNTGSGFDKLADKFNGLVTTVTRAKMLKLRSSYFQILELEDCVSPKGIPYTFLADWVEVAS